MGGCASSPQDAEAIAASRAIDKALKNDAKEIDDSIRLLLLGSGESGKSTILKQMKLIYGKGFATDEQVIYRTAIQGNAITAAKALCWAMDSLKIPYGFDPEVLATPAPAIPDDLDRLESLSSQHNASRPVSAIIGSIGGGKGSDILGSEESLDDSRSNMESPMEEEGEAVKVVDAKAKAAEAEYKRVGGSRQVGPGPLAAAKIKSTPFTHSGDSISAEIVDAIKLIWNDPGIQYCYSRANEFQLIDCCKYFITDIDRICVSTYTPTPQDILHCRTMTTNITETKMKSKNERKKWAPYFDDVSAIIFLAAISSYDQVCYEDNSTNRILEALNLFASICNHPLFKTTSMILFLNKIDLFTEKIKTSPVSQFFPDYIGDDTDYGGTSTFFANKFLAINKYPERKIYVHFTWATDTKQTRKVLDTVNKIILGSNLDDAGIA
ncbi:guanine nucleotide binding protein, alpha subunit [Rhizoclosmatium globosum]|uniref:Guanine nucleotide binding protein, alpha subunit n=1 Tax=Rhizoclosmatium globosum TaxID=329046 RepID=A0A1Y2CXC7_9FUNG|nr:guanine nucleotide binding protein, alpha subunit [Rhizoclosmatium globosum]|eukprot:ORY51670.1 guanine nucleotide binding protein, alpha subunit [Rhizoclosmatium globosum]